MNAIDATKLSPELEPLRVELETFYRTLPQLLADGETGRWVLIKGTELHEVWDTYVDAKTYGYVVFKEPPFLVQRIDPRYLPVLGKIFDRPADAEAADHA